MTQQIAEKLDNRHPRVTFGDLCLWGVVRGDLAWVIGDGKPKLNAFEALPQRPANALCCSALWRGRVACFLLQENGRLKLTAYEWMIPGADGIWDGWHKQVVDELLQGDFVLLFACEHGFSSRTYVPFRDGVIVEDRSQWHVKPDYVYPEVKQ